VKRIVPEASSQLPVSQAASAAADRSRVAIVVAMPSQRPMTAPVRSSNSSAVVPRSLGFQALRPSPRRRAVSGMEGARSSAPRGAAAMAPTASASEPAYAGATAAMNESSTTSRALPLRSLQRTATCADLAPAKPTSSMRRSTR
jgi:hypothetical protein